MEVDAALEAFDTQRAGRVLTGYIDELSNWYVRRSRRRFWSGDPAALATLHECLARPDHAAGAVRAVRDGTGLAGTLRRTGAGGVGAPRGLADDRPGPGVIDAGLAEQVQLVRRGSSSWAGPARAESKVKTRQPSARALVSATGWSDLDEELRQHVRDELNVVDPNRYVTPARSSM